MRAFYLFISILNLNTCYAETLRGATLIVEPYVTMNNSEFEGFCVDLMNEIEKITGIEYTLYKTENGYGQVTYDGKVTGLIGEVYYKSAEFAIADMTVTDVRKRYVNFTESFMDLGFSALIKKNHVGKMKTLKDLADQTVVSYGSYRSGSTLSLFFESQDEAISRMYSAMMMNMDKLVTNKEQAIELVKSSKYAFIQESPANEYIASKDCNLTIIRDLDNYFPRQYAIALPINSPYLDVFNKAINQLKNNGTLNQLKEKYWNNECKNLDENSAQINSVSRVIFAVTLILILTFY